MRRLLALAWLSVALVAALPSQGAEVQDNRALVLGVIHDDAVAIKRRLEPMAAYVQTQLADTGIEKVLVLVAHDVRHMASLLEYDRVDWVSETPFNAIILDETKHAQMVARTWRAGSPTYRSLFFVRADSGLNSLADLPNSRIAFEQPASTSAFFVPAVEIIGESLSLCELQHPRDRITADCVGYAFAGNAFNTAAWVHKQIVDVGVFSTTDWESPAIPASFKSDFRILHESNPIPRGIELVRTNLDEAVKARLVEVLHGMHHDPQAHTALAAYFETRKFDPLSADDHGALARLRDALPTFERSVY